MFSPYLDIYVIIDRSSSTEDFNTALNLAVKHMISTFKNSPEIDNDSTFLTLIQFNEVCLDKDILISESTISELDPDNIPVIYSDGATNPSAALERALHMSQSRYDKWGLEGIDRKHPIIIYFTDGYPDAGTLDGIHRDENEQRAVEQAYEMTAERIRALEEENKLVFVGCAFSTSNRQANLSQLKKLTAYPGEHVLEIVGNGDMDQLIKFFVEVAPQTASEHLKNNNINIRLFM